MGNWLIVAGMILFAIAAVLGFGYATSLRTPYPPDTEETE